jgi:phosphohistidine phosphatase SixA
MASSSSVRLAIAFLALFITIAAGAAEPTVFVVRHAEKAKGGDEKDPDLSDAGRARAESIARVLKDAGITAIYATEFKRTQQTAEPLARSAEIAVTIVPAKETATLVAQVKATDGAALVVGHSNTVPQILQALGATTAVTIGDEDYDNLFVLAAGAPTKLIRLHLPVGP